MSPIRTAPTIRCPKAGAGRSRRSRRSTSTTATSRFQPSNLEITAVETSSKRAPTSSPARAIVQLNIRFNNLQRGADLVELVRRTAEEAAPGATVEARISGEAFLTPPGPLYEIVSEAIEAETGHRAASSRPQAARRTAAS